MPAPWRRRKSAGPTHDRSADASPALRLHLPFGIEKTEVAPDGQDRRRHRQGCQTATNADRQRDTEGLEVRQPGEVQAERSSRDGQARAQDHVSSAVIHGVESGFAVFAVESGFVVAAMMKMT